MNLIALTRNNITLIVALLISVLITVVIYKPALQGDYYHDDLQNLVKNKSVQVDQLNLASFKSAIFSSNAGTLKRPISMASFALNYYYFGESPFSFKVINLILHIITGILIFVLIFALQSAVNVTSTYSSQKSTWIAVTVSAFWLLLPLNVSTTAYIVQRMTILSAIFSILSIIFYIWGRIKLQTSLKIGLLLTLLSALCVVLAILSKENAILIFALIAMSELIIFRSYENTKIINNLIRYVFYAGCLSIITLTVIYFKEISIFFESAYKSREFSLTERLLTQFRILMHYIQWIIVPNINDLGLYHDDIPLSKSIFRPISTLFSFATICILILGSILARKKYPLISFGILWFFIGHILESTILPLELAYEHRNYLPSIGILLAVICSINIVLHKLDRRSLSVTLALLACVIFSWTTYIRSTQWSNTVDFSYYEALHHPNSPRATYALGRTYANLTIVGEERFKIDAFKYLSKAAALDRNQILPEVALILLSNAINEAANPIWLGSILQKLESSNYTASDLIALDALLKCKKDTCILSIDDANIILQTALADNDNLLSGDRLSKLLTIYANHLTNRAQDFVLAESMLLKAIDNSPNQLQYHLNYIQLLVHLNRTNEATVQLTKLKAIDQFEQKAEKIAFFEKQIDAIISDGLKQ